MDKLLLAALAVAVGTSALIGIQSAMSGAAGRLAGPVVVGLFVNAVGGLVSLAVLALLVWRGGAISWEGVRASAGLWGAAGVIGIAVIVGVAFAVGRLGTAAGVGAIIGAEVVVALALDALGFGGARIPIGPSRLAGLLLLAGALWLLLPRHRGSAAGPVSARPSRGSRGPCPSAPREVARRLAARASPP